MKNKKRNKKKDGSVLVVTLILFGIIVVTALSVAVSTLRQTRTSMQSSKTNIAYQNADEGVDKVMKVILKERKAYSSGKIIIASITGTCGSQPCLSDATCCTSGGNDDWIVSGGSGNCNGTGWRFKVSLWDSTPSQIPCNSTNDISDIAQLKSYGNDNAAGTQRIISANVDQKSKDIKLLLHMDGIDGASNFVDSSRTHHAVNVTGAKTSIVASLPDINPNYSVANFDGSGDYLLTNDVSEDLASTSAPFTVDFWANFNNDTSTSDRTFLHLDGSGSTSNDFLIMKYNPGTKLMSVTTPGGTCTYSGSGNWDGDYGSNKWIHFAFVRDKDNKPNLYIDGEKRTLAGSCDYSGNSFSLEKIYIGSNNSGSNSFLGYVDEFRLVFNANWNGDFEDNCPVDKDNNDKCKPY